MTNRATLLKQVNQTKKVDEVLKDWQVELVKRHLSGKKTSNKTKKVAA